MTNEEALAELQNVRTQLRQCEERYRVSFEYTGTAMLVVDADTSVVMWNHKLEEVTGYTAEDAFKGRKWTEFVADEDLERMRRFHELRRLDPHAKIPDEYEFRLRHKNGSIRDMLINVAMIPGTPRSLLSLIDITERKQTVALLQESERRFKEIADLLPGIICEFDAQLQLTYINKKGLETFGFNPGDFEQGINAMQVLPPHEQSHAQRDLANVFSGDFGTPDEYELLRKDGSTLWALVNSAPVFNDGMPAGMRTCILDITERRMAQQSLRESEERFRGIFSQSPIGIALYTTDGIAVESNDSFKVMFAGDAGAALFHLVSPDDSQRTHLAAGQSIRCQSVADPADVPPSVRTAKRHLDWQITPLRKGPSGSPVWLAQVQDITERTLAEQARLCEAQSAAEKANQLVRNLRKDMIQTFSFNDMVSRSPHMREIFNILPQMAEAATTILVCGESGTGKELIARSLHELSLRKAKPFIAINCGALPDNLLESELFGYKAGAFTDAKKDKPGKFALAEGGTVFLDEIGDISPAMQVKLLRVIQERVYEPLGGVRSEKTDVRIVAATNKDLPAMMRAGAFREDLYYRINVLQIKLPPLRDRRSDIPLLCEHFIGVFNTRYNRGVTAISDDALCHLTAHSFPGNIRELENIIERAFVFCKGTTIESSHLPPELKTTANPETAQTLATVGSLDELEALYLKNIIEEAGGSKVKAAEKLGVHKTTLFRKLKKLNIQ